MTAAEGGRIAEGEDRKSEAGGQMYRETEPSYVTRAICSVVFFLVFSQPRFTSLAAKLDISRAIKSNLLRKRPIPSARVISMASTLEWSVGDRANNTADFKRSYVHVAPVNFISSTSFFSSYFRSPFTRSNNVNIQMHDSSRN